MKKCLFLTVLSLLLFSCTKEEKSTGIQIDGKTEYTLGNTAVNLTIKVKCSSTWEYGFSEDIDWIEQTQISSQSVQFFVKQNSEAQNRSVKILFYCPNKSNPLSQAEVSVTQNAAPFDPQLSISPQNSVTVNADAQNTELAVETNLESWEFEFSQEYPWISASKSTGGMTVSFSANSSEDPRSATGLFYAPSKSNPTIQKSYSFNQEGKIVEYDPEYLSESGTSNCYLITHRGEYSFDATKCGNGKTVSGLSAPATLAPAGVKLLWQSSRGIVQSLSLKDGKITFFANRIFGNFLIAATDANGAIIWSWHIWFPKEAPAELQTVSGFKIMQYNLGAVDSRAGELSSYGLLYQWGRKDPFPGSPKPCNGDVTMKNVDVYDINNNVFEIGSTKKSTTIEESIKNPTVCNGNASQYTDSRDWLVKGKSNNSLWGNPDGWKEESSKYINDGTKTYFDPCPLGWRVPPIRTFTDFTEMGGMVWASGETTNLKWGNLGGSTNTAVVDLNNDGKYSIDDDWKNGWHFYLDKFKSTMSYFPATSRYDGQYALLMGSMVGLWGNYWYNAPDKNQGMAYALAFGIKEYSQAWSVTIGTNSCGSKADAYSIRCIKE